MGYSVKQIEAMNAAESILVTFLYRGSSLTGYGFTESVFDHHIRPGYLGNTLVSGGDRQRV